MQLDGHHVFGRVGKYADTPELLLAICRSCHDAIHRGDQEKADKARSLALSRFTERWDLELPELMEEAGPDLVDVLRLAVRRLEERTGG